MRILLYGYQAANRRDLLEKYLATPWMIDELFDIQDRQAARARIAQADAMVGLGFEPDLAEVATRLKLIHMPGAGVNTFDLSVLPPGCALCNVHEHEVPIAEYVMLNILLHVTQQNRYAATVRQGRWDGSGRHDGAFHDEAMGKTLGLIGFGHIGREVARRAQAFGMRVMAVRRRPGTERAAHLDWCGPTSELPRLLREVDFLVITCPLTPETQGMIGSDELAQLKPTAFVINPARGPVIDEQALYQALRDGRIAGAALDAHYQYPPDLTVRQYGWTCPFHELDNVVLTPHFSAWTAQMVDRRWRKIARNLDHLARGEPLERVVHRA